MLEIGLGKLKIQAMQWLGGEKNCQPKGWVGDSCSFKLVSLRYQPQV